MSVTEMVKTEFLEKPNIVEKGKLCCQSSRGYSFEVICGHPNTGFLFGADFDGGRIAAVGVTCRLRLMTLSQTEG